MSTNDTQDQDERAIVAGAKRQAKRLLRLAKNGPLQITALNEALGIVAQLHGYPNWHAMASYVPEQKKAASGKPHNNEGEDTRLPEPYQLELIRLNRTTHLFDMKDLVGRVATESGGSLITPHFKALEASTKADIRASIRFVSLEESIGANFLISPIATMGMLREHMLQVVDTILSISHERARITLRSVLMQAIEGAYRDKKKNPNRFDMHLVDLSSPAKKLMGKQAPASFFEAAGLFREHGLIDDMWACHLRAQPTLTDLYGAIGYIQSPTNIEAHQNQARELIRLWMEAGAGQQPWNFKPQDNIVFEVDPTRFDHKLPAKARWMVVHLLTTLVRVSAQMAELSNKLSHNAYEDHELQPRGLQIEPEELERIVKWHAKQAHQERENLVILDEMDGPLRSEVLAGAIGSWARRVRKSRQGLWIIAEDYGQNTPLHRDQLLGMLPRNPTPAVLNHLD